MTRKVFLRIIIAVIIIMVLASASVIVNRADSRGSVEVPSGFFH